MLHDDAKHFGRYLGLVPSFDLNVHVLICSTGSKSHFLSETHVSKPFRRDHVSPPLYSLKYRTIFVMTSVVWRFLFEESQTLSWFMHAHVYKTANTCNNASTGANKMHNFLWLKHMYLCNPCAEFLRALNNSSTSFLTLSILYEVSNHLWLIINRNK